MTGKMIPMSKVLAKTFRDAAREGRLTVGTKEVVMSAKDSSLVVLANSDGSDRRELVLNAVEEADIPIVHFDGTSLALGKLGGLQFRVSALAIRDLDQSIVGTILKENERTK